MSAESETRHNEVIDLISTASHKIEETEEADGTKKRELILDPESIYWETRNIDSNTFGRFVLALKNFQSLAYDGYQVMSKDAAVIWKQQIERIVDNYKKSIDGKGSETMRDSHNSRLNMIDKLSKNKQERVYTLSDNMKKSMFDGILGRNVEKEEG